MVLDTGLNACENSELRQSQLEVNDLTIIEDWAHTQALLGVWWPEIVLVGFSIEKKSDINN